MKNKEKIDIKLEVNTPDKGASLTEEQRNQKHYETALRYINIARYMKQYEDQDKYYHRALQNLEKASPTMPELAPLIKEITDKQYFARAQGKITLYEEASRIRDHAQTTTDYYSAQTLFERIHKYEGSHPIPESSVSPELYARVCQCADSEEQSARCSNLAEKLTAQQHRKRTISSSALIMIVIAILAFSRTILSRQCLARFFAFTGHYTRAYESYEALYKKTADEQFFEQYKECKYLASREVWQTSNTETIRSAFRELAGMNYKDSEKYLVKMEKARIAEMKEGEKIRFGDVNWRILAHDGNHTLLLKDKTVGSAPFQKGGGAAIWESSSIRSWLNTVYIDELFSFGLEKEAILNTEIPSSGNAVLETQGGQAAKDKLFLLSAEEFNSYKEYIPETRNLWWLRTPGNTPGTISFVSPDKYIMDYGYETGTEEIKARPAIWVDTTVTE